MASETSGTEPQSWPEVPAPAGAVSCMNCELHRQRSRVVWGEGVPDAPVIAVLDNPGAREDKTGQPFVCATRIALQRALAEADFPADRLYATYLLKCRPIRAYDKEAAREACAPYLLGQLGETARAGVMLLGLVAARALLGLPEAEMGDLRGKLHQVAGLPARVTYHPLAVHRRPNLRKGFVDDWRAAKELWLPGVQRTLPSIDADDGEQQ